jgi:hypothetical protein
MKFNNDDILNWYEIYIVDGKGDVHSKFATAIAESRDTAKELAYKIAYSISQSDIIKAFKESK